MLIIFCSAVLLSLPCTADVRQYGAKGDGKTDDQAAVTRAIRAASVTPGSTVYFSPGTYAHSGVIDFPSNTIVNGSGSASVLFGTTPSTAAIRFTGVSNCTLQNLSITSAPSGRLLNDDAAGVLFSGASGCSVSGVTVSSSAQAGINVHGSADINISNVTILGTMADGVHVVSGSQRVQVSNSTAINTGDDSFSAVAYGDQPQTTDVTFTGNVSLYSKARGITCIGANNCVIQGNTVISPVAHGMAVAYESSYHTWHPYHARVLNNLIRGVASSGMNPLLVYQATDVELGGNDIENSKPVYITGSTDVWVHDGRILNALSTGLLATSTHGLTITILSVLGAQGAGFVLDGITGGDVSNATLLDVQKTIDPWRGAIDILNSSNVTGVGNLVIRSGASAGWLRVINSTGITVAK